VQVEQAGAGLGDQRPEFLVGGLPAGVVLLEVGDQFGGEPATGLAHQVARTHPRQQCLRLGRGEVLLRPARQ
jgi:hypothetical protein